MCLIYLLEKMLPLTGAIYATSYMRYGVTCYSGYVIMNLLKKHVTCRGACVTCEPGDICDVYFIDKRVSCDRVDHCDIRIYNFTQRVTSL